MIPGPKVEQGNDGKWYALEDDDDAWNGPFDTESEAMRHAFGDSGEDDVEPAEDEFESLEDDLGILDD